MLRYSRAQRATSAPLTAAEKPAAQRVSNRSTAQPELQRVGNRPFVEQVTEESGAATLVDVAQKAMNYADNNTTTIPTPLMTISYPRMEYQH